MSRKRKNVLKQAAAATKQTAESFNPKRMLVSIGEIPLFCFISCFHLPFPTLTDYDYDIHRVPADASRCQTTVSAYRRPETS